MPFFFNLEERKREVMNDILVHLPNETEDQCLWRVGRAKDAGTLTENWPEIALFFNKTFREDDTQYYDPSAYRKKYRNFVTAYESIFSQENFTSSQIAEYEDQKKEMFKIKKQWQDQRRECIKLWTEESRFDHLVEKLIESATRLCEIKPLTFDDYILNYDNSEAVICWADWHYGMVTDNIWNQYNTDICIQRVAEFVNKAVARLSRHGVKRLHIMLLGDAAHGSIHNSCRVASEEDTCDQLMQVSEIMAEAINELSNYVPEVNVYATYGNHLRTVQNKNDSIHSDNMEKIIPWWLEQRLQNNSRVNIIKGDYYEFIYLNVCGYNVVGAHGDLEKFKQFGLTVNTLFNKKYGMSIDYTVSADKHHIEEFEQLGIESILVRSLCGTDEYSNNNRLYSAPGQTLMIFTPEEGRDGTYNIKLH
jgi:hypothetical protein